MLEQSMNDYLAFTCSAVIIDYTLTIKERTCHNHVALKPLYEADSISAQPQRITYNLLAIISQRCQ